MTARALAAVVGALAGCAPPVALGALDLSAVAEPPDASTVDDSGAADGPECPADLLVVTHFYPELEQQVERYHCPGCHSAGPAPRLVVGDTVQAQRNYLALHDLAGPSLIVKLADFAHCGDACVPPADLVSWARWVAAPVP